MCLLAVAKCPSIGPPQGSNANSRAINWVLLEMGAAAMARDAKADLGETAPTTLAVAGSGFYGAMRR